MLWKEDYIRREIKVPESGHTDLLIKIYHNYIRKLMEIS